MSCDRPVPSAFIAQMWPPRTNAIRVPSGDQAGSISAVVFEVSGVWPLPSGFMT